MFCGISVSVGVKGHQCGTTALNIGNLCLFVSVRSTKKNLIRLTYNKTHIKLICPFTPIIHLFFKCLLLEVTWENNITVRPLPHAQTKKSTTQVKHHHTNGPRHRHSTNSICLERFLWLTAESVVRDAPLSQRFFLGQFWVYSYTINCAAKL